MPTIGAQPAAWANTHCLALTRQDSDEKYLAAMKLVKWFYDNYALPVVSVGIIWQWILERSTGLLNCYLEELGVIEPINWLVDAQSAMPSIAITTIWWTVNGNMIIYLAGLQDIPADLYEAAKVDGASVWQEMRYITVPTLLPVNAFVIPLTVIACWRVFGQAWVMTRGGPQGSTLYHRPIHLSNRLPGLPHGAGIGGRRYPDAHYARIHRRSAMGNESDLGGSR